MRVLPATWVKLPGGLSVASGGSKTVDLKVTVPATASPGAYGATVLVRQSSGTILHIPVLVTVPLHDANTAAGSVGPQGAYASDRDVFGKADTIWPSVLGAANGAGADWTVFPVDLANDLGEVVISAYDTAGAADETYDLYLYDAHLDLVASTHPFTSDRSGVTDVTATRTPSSEASPALLRIPTPAGGRHYLAVNRAHVVDDPPGYPSQSVGSFALRLDEVRGTAVAAAAALTYDGDASFVQGRPGVLAVHLRTPAGAGIAGRTVTFAFDGAACCAATTDYDGLAQVPFDAAALVPGVHELVAAFAGDTHWQATSVSQLVLVVGADGGPAPGGGSVSGGGWIKPVEGKVDFTVSATGALGADRELPAPRQKRQARRLARVVHLARRERELGDPDRVGPLRRRPPIRAVRARAEGRRRPRQGPGHGPLPAPVGGLRALGHARRRQHSRRLLAVVPHERCSIRASLEAGGVEATQSQGGPG